MGMRFAPFSLSPARERVGRGGGASACGTRVFQTTPRPAEEALMPCPSPPPSAGEGQGGKSSTCRAPPNKPRAPYSTASYCRRAPKEPAKVVAASVATPAGRKRTTPSPYPPPRWGEGLGCGRCAPGLLSTWAMGGGMRRLSCGGRRLCLPSTADPPKPLFPLPWLKGTGSSACGPRVLQTAPVGRRWGKSVISGCAPACR